MFSIYQHHFMRTRLLKTKICIFAFLCHIRSHNTMECLELLECETMQVIVFYQPMCFGFCRFRVFTFLPGLCLFNIKINLHCHKHILKIASYALGLLGRNTMQKKVLATLDQMVDLCCCKRHVFKYMLGGLGLA